MKNKLILVGVDGRPSMKSVFSKMTDTQAALLIRKCPKNKNCYYQQYNENSIDQFVRVTTSPIAANTVLIRWGNRIELETTGSTIIYNKSDAIKTATDKRFSRKLFYDKGIRIPLFVRPDTIQSHQYPVIARPLTHSKGKNFVILNDFGAFKYHYDKNQENWYYSEFINKTAEYRVHCAHGKVLAIMSKPAPVNSSIIAWNRAINGEEFTALKWSEFNYDVCRQALQAVSVLGLDFGGVDVMVKDDQAYVLEVNTAPTLNSSPYVSMKYAAYFDWLFGSDTRKDHFEYTAYKKVESFAWKQTNFTTELISS